MILGNAAQRAWVMIAVGAACVFGSAVALAQDAPQRPPAPPLVEPKSPRAAEVVGKPPPIKLDDERLDRILTRLEDRKITDLRCKVKWETSDPKIKGDVTVKSGTLWYLDREPVPMFRVHFVEKVENRRKDVLDEQHLFDGRWYVELNSITKTVTRREVRAADDTRNPYKLGEGAFPLPFGQKKADIVREFDVSYIEPDAKKDPPNTDHIKLIPREGTRTDESYKSIEFWIAREDGKLSGLPIKVLAAQRGGTGGVKGYIAVTFNDVELDVGLAGSVFVIETPPGYQTINEPLNASAPKIKPEDMIPAGD